VNKLLANIGYLRENGHQDHRWQTIGGLFYDETKHSACIRLNGWRQGLCIAKPFTGKGVAIPFLRGELTFKVGIRETPEKTEIERLFVGFISTNVPDGWDAESHYAVKLEAMPLTPNLQSPAGIWIEVHLDDADGRPM